MKYHPSKHGVCGHVGDSCSDEQGMAHNWEGGGGELHDSVY